MKRYHNFRNHFINHPNEVIDLERQYFDALFEGILKNAKDIQEDFDKTMSIKDFWYRYSPRQRGHKPRGTSLPWGEVGEKLLAIKETSLFVAKQGADGKYFGTGAKFFNGGDLTFGDSAGTFVDANATGSYLVKIFGGFAFVKGDAVKTY